MVFSKCCVSPLLFDLTKFHLISFHKWIKSFASPQYHSYLIEGPFDKICGSTVSSLLEMDMKSLQNFYNINIYWLFRNLQKVLTLSGNFTWPGKKDCTNCNMTDLNAFQVEISDSCVVMHSSLSYVTVNRKPVSVSFLQMQRKARLRLIYTRVKFALS